MQFAGAVIKRAHPTRAVITIFSPTATNWLEIDGITPVAVAIGTLSLPELSSQALRALLS
jgi:hypothetical protein